MGCALTKTPLARCAIRDIEVLPSAWDFEASEVVISAEVVVNFCEDKIFAACKWSSEGWLGRFGVAHATLSHCFDLLSNGYCILFFGRLTLRQIA